MRDNVKARIMRPDGSYVHISRAESEEAVNSQEYLYRDAYRRQDEKAARQEKLRASREKSAAKKPAAKKAVRRKTGEKTRKS